jgi:hypothetical protein
MHSGTVVGVFFCGFLSSAFAQSDEPVPPAKVKTLIMPFALGGSIDPSVAQSLTDAVQTVFASSEVREVISQADLTALLDLEAQKNLIGCKDSGCLEEIALAMDVDSLITGTVAQVGEEALVTLTELDAKSFSQLARVQGNTAFDELSILRLTADLAEELLVETSGKIKLFGDLKLETVPSGAEVMVDNRDAGQSPLELELPIGVHRIVIRGRSPGEAPAVFDVVIHRKERTTVHAELSVEQTVPEEKMRIFEETRKDHDLFMLVKGTIGGCACMAGSVGFTWSSIAMLLSIESYIGALSLLLSGSMIGVLSAAMIFATNLIPCIVIGGFCVGGALLIGWAGSDYSSRPEAPLPDVPQHLIKVAPAKDAPKFYRLPAREPSPMAH